MKNSKLWFIGLATAVFIGAFYAIPFYNPSTSVDVVGEQQPNTNKNDEFKIGEEKSNILRETEDKLQVTLAQVSPDGSSLFGGVGPKGKTVVLFNGDIIIAEAKINDKGDWVAIPEKRFESGSHFIQLGIKPSPGENESSRVHIRVESEKVEQDLSKSDDTGNLPLTPETKNNSAATQILNTDISDLAVVVDIEENKKEKPLVVFVPKSDASIPIVVQSPEFADKKVNSTESDIEKDVDRLRSVSTVLDAVDKISNSLEQGEFIQIRSLSWEDNSKLRLSGFAAGGTTMRAYFDEQFIALISLNNSGSDLKSHRWSMVTEANMKANKKYSLRAELLDQNDKIIKVSELKISSDLLEVGKDGSDMMVIHKGDALWRIAYRAYGKGVRYVDIFRRNNARISDPDLIYPNQIFAIPD